MLLPKSKKSIPLLTADMDTETISDATTLTRTTTALVPTSRAQFKGSFAAHNRHTRNKIIKPGCWRDQLHQLLFTGWKNPVFLKAAFVELVGTAVLCYLSGLIGITITNLNTNQKSAYIGVTNIFLTMLLIYSTAPASGGHLNPMITFSTLATGLTEFPRAMLYMPCQILGAAIAGGLIRGSMGEGSTKKYHGGGCFTDSTVIPTGQAFVVESVSSFILIFLISLITLRFFAYGVGLDPRQVETFGPRLGPLLVGCALGISTFASSGLVPGFAGAGMNPARCFSFAVARGNFDDQWIWWVGPLVGSLVQIVCYHISPSYEIEKM